MNKKVYMFDVIKGIRKQFRNHSLRSMFITSFATISVGSVFYHFVEGMRWIDSIYFSVITLTTVGYGDISPKTDFGKLFTIFYVIIGIGIIFGFINSYYAYQQERRNSRHK